MQEDLRIQNVDSLIVGLASMKGEPGVAVSAARVALV